MDYSDLLYKVVEKDIEYEELIDKAVEKYLDSINYKPEIKTVLAKSPDEMDQKDYIEKSGFKLKSITYYKSLAVAIMLFEKL